MSVKEISTTVVECDVPNCYEVFSDVVELDESTAIYLAKYHGWRIEDDRNGDQCCLCPEHARQSNRSRHNALYSTPAWQRLSARVLRVWRG